MWRGSFSCLKKPEPTFMPAAPRPLLPVARVLRGVPVLPLPTAMSFQTRRVTTTPVAVCGRTWLVRNTIGNTSGLRGARHCFKQLGPSRPPQIRVPRSPRSRMCLWSPSWGRRGPLLGAPRGVPWDPGVHRPRNPTGLRVPSCSGRCPFGCPWSVLRWFRSALDGAEVWACDPAAHGSATLSPA